MSYYLCLRFLIRLLNAHDIGSHYVSNCDATLLSTTERHLFIAHKRKEHAELSAFHYFNIVR
jgi:hypothetical protein